MIFRLNVPKLKDAVTKHKGGAKVMIEKLGTSASKYHYNLNKGSFDTEFLLSICNYLGVSPAEFFDTPAGTETNQPTVAAEPEPTYGSNVKNFDREIIQRLQRLEDKIDKQSKRVLEKIDNIEKTTNQLKLHA